MRSLIYIIALNLCFAALAENPYGAGPKAKKDHFLDDGGGRGGQPNGEEPPGDEVEVKPKRLFDSFGDSLRAADERHQAQVEAIVAGRARAPRGAAQTGVFKSFPSADEARAAARPLRRADPATESPKKPGANPFR